jgi:transcriptional regulator with XRE-family HTH domain
MSAVTLTNASTADAIVMGPDPIDVEVGARIRARRVSLGISQTALAKALGLTFQQVQKYERGVNRVSASKLYETAQVLQAPVTHFFEGLDGEPAIEPPADGETSVTAFLLTTEGLELATLFPRIPKGRMRHQVLELVRTLADD